MDVLSSPILILNRGWQPVSICRLKKALSKCFMGSLLFVDPDNYSTYEWVEWYSQFSFLKDEDGEEGVKYINTSKRKILVPEVAILPEFNKIPKRTVRLSKKNLCIRDDFTCQYTGKKLSIKEGTIDHVLPVSRGGTTVWENVVLCSKEANTKKGNRLLNESGLRLLNQPKAPFWRPIYTYYVSNRPLSWDKFVPLGKKKKNL